MKRTSKKTMKMYSILLASVMMLGLTSCGKTEEAKTDTGDITITASAMSDMKLNSDTGDITVSE